MAKRRAVTPPFQPPMLLKTGAGPRIAIDPGISGAMVVVDDDLVLRARGMPQRDGLSTDRAVNPFKVCAVLREWAGDFGADTPVFIEHVRGFVGDKSAITNFNFGGYVLACEAGVLESGLPHYLVPPQTWKAKCGLLRQPKDLSRYLAAKTYPLAYAQVSDNTNFADACLLGHVGPLLYPETHPSQRR